MPLIKIHNAETGEIIEREMNEKELAQYELERVAAEKEASVKGQKGQANAALLEKLGITEDEAKLLLS